MALFHRKKQVEAPEPDRSDAAEKVPSDKELEPGRPLIHDEVEPIKATRTFALDRTAAPQPATSRPGTPQTPLGDSTELKLDAPAEGTETYKLSVSQPSHEAECPGCKAPLPLHCLVCTACGYDMRTGQRPAPAAG